MSTGQLLGELDDEALAALAGQIARAPALRADLGVLGRVGKDHLQHPLGLLECGLDGVGDPRAGVGGQFHPVDDDVDGVVVVLVEIRALDGEVVLLAVDLDARVPVSHERLEAVLEGPLLVADHGRTDLRSGPFGELEQPFDHPLGALLADLPSALGTVRRAHAGVQQPQVVVEFGDRPDRRPGVVRGVLLVDRDGGREPLDVLDLGFVHLPEEVPSVGAERLDVAALTLRVHRLERERGLARPREAGDDRELLARDGHVDVLQVVFGGTADDDVVGHYRAKGVAA